MYIVVNSNLTWWLFKGFKRWEPPKSCIVISEVDLAISSTNLSFDIPFASAAANSLLLKLVLNAGTISPESVEYSPWWSDVLCFRTLGDFLFDAVAVVFYGMAKIFLLFLPVKFKYWVIKISSKLILVSNTHHSWRSTLTLDWNGSVLGWYRFQYILIVFVFWLHFTSSSFLGFEKINVC